MRVYVCVTTYNSDGEQRAAMCEIFGYTNPYSCGAIAKNRMYN